jgi:hypothetical protein
MWKNLALLATIAPTLLVDAAPAAGCTGLQLVYGMSPTTIDYTKS